MSRRSRIRKRKNLSVLKECIKCHNKYNWHKSTSSLKMTYCTSICEVADLGFHLKSWEEGRPTAIVDLKTEVVEALSIDEPLDTKDNIEDDDSGWEFRDLVPA